MAQFLILTNQNGNVPCGVTKKIMERSKENRSHSYVFGEDDDSDNNHLESFTEAVTPGDRIAGNVKQVVGAEKCLSVRRAVSMLEISTHEQSLE